MYDFYIDFLQPQLDLFEGDLSDIYEEEEEEEEEEDDEDEEVKRIKRQDKNQTKGKQDNQVYLQDEGGRILTLRKRIYKREVV